MLIYHNYTPFYKTVKYIDSFYTPIKKTVKAIKINKIEYTLYIKGVGIDNTFKILC
jgi:hypothetical protein